MATINEMGYTEHGLTNEESHEEYYNRDVESDYTYVTDKVEKD